MHITWEDDTPGFPLIRIVCEHLVAIWVGKGGDAYGVPLVPDSLSPDREGGTAPGDPAGARGAGSRAHQRAETIAEQMRAAHRLASQPGPARDYAGGVHDA